MWRPAASCSPSTENPPPVGRSSGGGGRGGRSGNTRARQPGSVGQRFHNPRPLQASYKIYIVQKKTHVRCRTSSLPGAVHHVRRSGHYTWQPGTHLLTLGGCREAHKARPRRARLRLVRSWKACYRAWRARAGGRVHPARGEASTALRFPLCCASSLSSCASARRCAGTRAARLPVRAARRVPLAAPCWRGGAEAAPPPPWQARVACGVFSFWHHAPCTAGGARCCSPHIGDDAWSLAYPNGAQPRRAAGDGGAAVVL